MTQLKFSVPQQHREQTRLLLPGLQNHMTTYPECPCHICHSSWLPGSLLSECQRNTGTRHFAAGPPCPISGSGISLCCCSLQWKVFAFILHFFCCCCFGWGICLQFQKSPLSSVSTPDLSSTFMRPTPISPLWISTGQRWYYYYSVNEGGSGTKGF